MEASFMERYLTPIAVVIGALIIALAFAYGKGGTTGTEQKPTTVDIKEVKTSGSPFVGEPGAPVTMAYWFDYQCPFCKQFEQTTMQQIYENYVKTGKVKIVFKDFQFLGPDSDTASLYARAVWDGYPDQFYTWYMAIMAAQDEENGGFGDLASIKKLTATIPGIDTAKIDTLMNDNKSKYQAAIAADRNEGQSFGINGTPSFIVGTTILSGAQPYAVVSKLIDAELAK